MFVFINPKGILSGGQQGILINDTTRVNRIEIFGRDTIILSKSSNGKWILNNELKINPVSISNFLYSFQKMTVKGMTYNIDPSDTASIRIKIHSGKKKYFYRFYPAGGKSLLHKEGSKKIYSVEVLGTRKADLNEVFYDDPDHWQDRTIIDLLPDEIKFVKVEHPGSPENDFVVRVNNKIPSLYESDGNTNIPDDLVDIEELNMYTSYFMNIFFDYTIRAKLPAGVEIAESHRYVVTITSVTGETIKLSVFPIYREKVEDIFNAGIRTNDNHRMLVARYVAFDLLLRNKKDFFRK